MGVPFRWGIIGPGRIAKKFSAAVEKLPNTNIYAIASRSTVNPNLLRQSLFAEVCYSSYEDLVTDPKVDAVYISTPHRFHYENIKLCLEAGKPTLCEKSFTVNAKQAAEVFQLSKSRQIFLMEALWTRFLPIYSHVRKWLEDDKIGEVHLVTSTYGFVPPRDPKSRLYNIELAGGALLDIGVYNTALTQWVFQRSPIKIQAIGQIGKTGIDEMVSANFAYENGAAAQFSCTFQAPAENNLIITGTQGRIIIHPKFLGAISATLESTKKTKNITKRKKINGLEYQIVAAMNAIQKGQLDCIQMTQSDTLENLRVLDIIRQQIGLQYPFE